MSSGASPTDRSGLVRAIGPWALAANAVNLTLGAGIFVIPATAANIMGSSALFGYLLCAFTMALVLACFAEIGSRVTGSGGAYAYVEAAFGPWPALVIGMLMCLGYAAASDAAIAHVCLDSLGEVWPLLRDPWPRRIALVVIVGAIVGLNLIGVRAGIRFVAVLTAAKIAPVLLLLGAGIPAIIAPDAVRVELPSAGQLGDGAVLLFFVFAGAECALTPSGEIRHPERSIPKALFGAILVLAILFVGLQWVAQAVLGGELPMHKAPLAAASEVLLGSPGRWLLLSGAVLSTLGTLSGDILATPRLVYAMALDGGLPRRLGAVSSRFHTPVAAIVFFGIVVCGFALSGAFRELAVLSSASVLVIYLSVCLAALRLRYAAGENRGFRLPGGPVIHLMAVASVVWLLAHLSRREWISLGLFTAVASMLYALRRPRLRAGRSP